MVQMFPKDRSTRNPYEAMRHQRRLFAELMVPPGELPEVKTDDDGGDSCCAEARMKWIAFVEKTFAPYSDAYEMGSPEFPLNEELLGDATQTDTGDFERDILQGYEDMSCEDFKMILENIAGVKSDHPIYNSHNERKGLPRTNESFEAERILADWNKCEFSAGEDAEDMGFYASEDSFDLAWDSVLKMPYVQGSMREMTDEDIKRWGFEDDFAAHVPTDDRFEENTRMIGDFIDEESGDTLPIVIERPFRAKQEALEEDKGKRRIFGRGLRHSPYMAGYIPLDHLGMNPNKAHWFGGEVADPHAVLDSHVLQQIYTPKNYRRRGMASSILDALVEAKRFTGESDVGFLSTAKDPETGQHIHDMRVDEEGRETARGRPWVDTETGAPVWNRSPFKISPPSEATKDFVHLMLSRGLYPNQIRSRGKIMGDGDHEIEVRDASKRWQGEGALEGKEYFDVMGGWSGYIGDTEEAKRARGWGLDEEQHYIRPTFGTAFDRAKLYGELQQKMRDELDKASDRCPQDGEPDPVTGKVHPYFEDSDVKEPNGCDCWDDWRKAREDFWAAFPEEKSDWWDDDEDYDEELTEDDLIPENSFHLAEKLKDFNRRVDEGEIAPAPKPVWNEEKNAFEYGGKTTQEWLDLERKS